MSSAILYAAIVAIWACVLVPRWLRRSHEAPAEPDSVPGQEEAADRADVADPAEPDMPGQHSGDVPGAATPSEQGAGAPYPDPVAWEAQADVVFVAASDAEAGHPTAEAPGGDPAQVSDSRAEAPGQAVDRDAQAGQGAPASHGGRAGRVGSGTHAAHGRQHRRFAAAAAHPGAERSRVLRARRRGLGLLIAMAAGTIGATFVGLLPVGFLAAPLAVLASYLLLLRAAAKANADNARKHAHARAHGVRAARTTRDLASEGSATGAAQPTAEVIDLGAVAACFDQPYDQYADAEARAVGD